MTNPSEQLARRIACGEPLVKSDLLVIACAEILGWKNIRQAESWDFVLYLEGDSPVNGDRDEIPDPFESPADALALLEVMRGEGWKGPDIHREDDGTWTCTLYRDGEKPTSLEEDWVITHVGTAPTFESAIVSAVLKAEGKG